MQEPRVQRKLAAIFASDMVGFSRLMEADETGTLARLKAHRLELIDPAIAKNGGRIIKTTGDGMLAEFASAVDAVECAVEIQRRLARRNADVAQDRHIVLRIGINLGDIVIDGDDIFGDGVNIAARLQESAQPGGINISHAVHEQIAGKLDVQFADLGEQQLKNISRPLHVYRLMIDPDSNHRRAGPAATVTSTVEQLSIAVLPFANMSGEADQDFFADGLTEDIITELSRFRDLLVISRNSTFVYKGRSVNVQEVARAFGVHYVVEGSVRKSGNRVRITVQLIDAKSDRHVWAERYDRELSDIFTVQDEVVSSIVGTLPGRVEAAAHERSQRNPTKDMRAYEYVLAAKVLHHRSRREDNIEAQRLIEKAIELDPNYAHAHAWRGCIIGQAWTYNWGTDPEAAKETVISELNTARSLDDNDSDVHRILAAISINLHNFDAAVHHQERALTLNPNNDLIVVQYGEVLTWIGEPEAGIPWILKAMRLNPHHPERFWNHLGRAHFVARDYKSAIIAFKRITKPDQFHHAFLAAAHAMDGDQTAAALHSNAVLSLDPAFKVENYMSTLHYEKASDIDHHREALLKAGLPA